MAIVRVTKEFSFDMAHALHNYDGLCRNIHGHTYRFQVTLIGEPNAVAGDPKLGMVIDFSTLKSIVRSEIVERFDHSLVVSKAQDLPRENVSFQHSDKFIVVDFQPTAENLVIYFAERIAGRLPQGMELHSARLWETPTSYAEWYAADNK